MEIRRCPPSRLPAVDRPAKGQSILRTANRSCATRRCKSHINTARRLEPDVILKVRNHGHARMNNDSQLLANGSNGSSPKSVEIK